MAEPPANDALNRATDQLERRLAEINAFGVSPLTPQAYDLLKRRVAEYIDELVDESVRVARRRPSSDVVSTADVNRASELRVEKADGQSWESYPPTNRATNMSAHS